MLGKQWNCIEDVIAVWAFLKTKMDMHENYFIYRDVMEYIIC